MPDKVLSKGDRVILRRGKPVNVQAEAARGGTSPPRRKLPPEPGRTDPETYVPEDEVLNKDQR